MARTVKNKGIIAELRSMRNSLRYGAPKQTQAWSRGLGWYNPDPRTLRINR